MSLASLAGLLATLALVLGLLLLTLRLLRTYAARMTGKQPGLRMEVVQRLPLGPKQGLAVVRIGERLVAVSVGEGGVRPVMELDEADVRMPVEQRESHGEPAAVASPGALDFRAVLRTSLKPWGVTLALLCTLAASARAQGSPNEPLGRVGLSPAAVQHVAPVTETSTGQLAVESQQAPQAPKSADSAIAALAPRIDLRLGQKGDTAQSGLRLSGSVGVVVMMGLLTLLPTLLLMMTSFTRILIVLHFLRQALGTQSAPPAQLVAAMALLLTGFVMAPTLSEMNRDALQPWMNGRIEQGQMLTEAAKPLRAFMLRQTRERDVRTFVEMSRMAPPASADQVPLVVLTSAFVTSELRTAFQIGFAIFLPFIIIDVVVSSVLMSMGMFMLPPAMISLPFKLLLFVLADGWTLVVQSLVASFR